MFDLLNQFYFHMRKLRHREVTSLALELARGGTGVLTPAVSLRGCALNPLHSRPLGTPNNGSQCWPAVFTWGDQALSSCLQKGNLRFGVQRVSDDRLSKVPQVACRTVNRITLRTPPASCFGSSFFGPE